MYPFPARGGRLRSDTGLPKKAGAKELGMKDGMELKVWSRGNWRGSARRAASATQTTAILVLGQPPGARTSRVLASGLSTAKRMMIVTIY